MIIVGQKVIKHFTWFRRICTWTDKERIKDTDAKKRAMDVLHPIHFSVCGINRMDKAFIRE
ncbi:hypothetical protein MACH16_04320 [Marinomonas pontica]|uniref:Transposase n=1 Tax=Marinomonas pontica TaxID=264739 RepID=A0ABM8FC88_9GAMM|nr:hypothetical protein MACH16_04320 [Marinomonas pontica]